LEEIEGEVKSGIALLAEEAEIVARVLSALRMPEVEPVVEEPNSALLALEEKLPTSGVAGGGSEFGAEDGGGDTGNGSFEQSGGSGQGWDKCKRYRARTIGAFAEEERNGGVAGESETLDPKPAADPNQVETVPAVAVATSQPTFRRSPHESLATSNRSTQSARAEDGTYQSSLDLEGQEVEKPIPVETSAPAVISESGCQVPVEDVGPDGVPIAATANEGDSSQKSKNEGEAKSLTLESKSNDWERSIEVVPAMKGDSSSLSTASAIRTLSLCQRRIRKEPSLLREVDPSGEPVRHDLGKPIWVRFWDRSKA